MGFHNMYLATGEVDYLDSAIGLAEDLVLSDGNTSPILSKVLETRELRRVVHDELFDVGTGCTLGRLGVEDRDMTKKCCNLDMCARRMRALTATLFDMFVATGGIIYLDDAIWVAEDIPDLDRYKQPLLAPLIEQRKRLESMQKTNPEGLQVDTEAEGALWDIESPRETIENIKELHDIFTETHDIDYRDNIIGRAAPLGQNATPLLDHLPERRKSCEAEPEELPQENPKPDDAPMESEVDKESRDAIGDVIGYVVDLAGGMDATESLRSLYSSFQASGNINDLNDAITRVKELVLVASSNEMLSYCLAILGDLSGIRHAQTGEYEDPWEAMGWMEQAITAIPTHYLARANMVSNFSSKFRYRFERYGDIEDLDQALAWGKQAADMTGADNPDRQEILSNLAAGFLRRNLRFGSLGDLEQAIDWAEQALAAAPPGHHDRSYRLSDLGAMIQNRYARFAVLEDLEQSIALSTEAAELMPAGDPNRSSVLANLEVQLSCKYERTGALEDLEESMAWVTKAISATPLDDTRRAMLLGCLGGSHLKRYVLLGDGEDLKQAIKNNEKALALTPLDSPTRSRILGSLGEASECRYDRLGAIEDLQQSIYWNKEAMEATPQDHPRWVAVCSNMSKAILVRYYRFGILEDLQEAIKLVEEALVRVPHDMTYWRAYLLGNLGALVLSKYLRLKALEDLERAAMLIEEGLGPILPGNTHRPGMLSALARIALLRYKRLGSMKDLEQAIQRDEESIAAVHPQSPNRAFQLNALARSLYERYRKMGSTKDFNRLIQISYEAWRCRQSPPDARIGAAIIGARALARGEMWQESSSLFGSAVRALPALSPRSLGRDDQEYRLSNFSPLASETASVTLQAGRGPSYALRLLELGRGIIMGLTIDCRSDLSALESQHPNIFQKFNRLRLELDSPPEIDSSMVGDKKGNHGPTNQHRYQRRERAAQELEETLVSIRALPGFEGFQLPPHSEDLMKMASEGPIIVFNSTEIRSDAIIVTYSTIKLLPLPKLFYESAEKRMKEMTKLIRGKQSSYLWRNGGMEEILLWLWEVAVEPVLNELELDKVNGDGDWDLPRVWWIGVGILAMAPFHAAGDHTRGSTRNTISRVISSYIPTIKALSYARQKELELLSTPNPHILLVSMPTTPGKNGPMPLKNATKEVKSILGLVEGKAIATHFDRPSTAQVLQELPSCQAVHFACHGVSDAESPSNSHLLLRKDDGSESGTLDRLTVGRISNTNLKHAQIAYLSACCTAQNVSSDLVDESIYIASGFQLAGFSHVLATQWISNDTACLQVAGDFYSNLFSGRYGKNHGAVSAAFHSAVKKLRDKDLAQPIKWACYIHTGA